MMRLPPPLPGAAITSGSGFWIRALARIIDVTFSLLLGLIGGLLAGLILFAMQTAGNVTPGWEARVQGANAAGLALSLLGGFLYHSFSEGIHGASLGKLICRLRVLQHDGRPSNMRGAFVRNLGWYVDSLFFGLIGYSSMTKSPLKQRYGDVWGKTIVVPTGQIPAAHLRSPVDGLLGISLGVICWTLLLTLGIVLKGM
jgi:uncharacterized RDD family membrane protein YckC